MRFTDRILLLHPAIVTTVFVVTFAGGGAAINIYPFGSAPSAVVFSLIMPLLLGPLLLWHYSLYRAASDRNAPNVGHRGRRAFLFVLASVALCIFLATQATLAYSDEATFQQFQAVLATSLIVGNLSYFASVWAAANALTRFGDQVKSTEFHKTLGTFILVLYLPIGIWVIYPRIKRLLAAPVSA